VIAAFGTMIIATNGNFRAYLSHEPAGQDEVTQE
jgi:hypothetical protein